MRINSVSKTILILLPIIFKTTAYSKNESYDPIIIETKSSHLITPFILNELRVLSNGLTLKHWLNEEIQANQMAANLNPNITSEVGGIGVNNDMTISDGGL